MNMVDIIRKKRDGGVLSGAEITFCLRGDIPDYQLAALLMAIYFRGLDQTETLNLTLAMRDSGAVLDLSGVAGIKADKHSSGGVGDKTTLVVAPLAAAAGLKMAKMSGRGLGFTGGTLDKLESIPGFRVGLGTDEFIGQVRDIGLSLIGQTAELAPADKLLYALRDVTATVESAPLIAASIMSKKLAVGADVLVLDVKYGSGAFMKNLELARQVAKQMVEIGRGAGRRVSSLLTPMEEPLGLAVGNALEMREAIAVLQGAGPADTRQLSLELTAELLTLSGLVSDRQQGAEMAAGLLDSGAAFSKFRQMVAAQGGDTDFAHLPQAPHIRPFTAGQAGYIYAMDCEKVGLAASVLGAGRQKKEDIIDHAAGLLFQYKLGTRVSAGQTIAELHCRDEAQARIAEQLLRQAIIIGEAPPVRQPLIAEII